MSLRTRLLLTYAGVVVLALLLAGGAFVALRWRERQQQAKDRLIVAATQLAFDLAESRRRGATPEQVDAAVRETAQLRGVRVLLVDRSGTVTVDSGDSLKGKRIEIPAEGNARRAIGYRIWDGRGPDLGGLVLLTPLPFVRVLGRADLRDDRPPSPSSEMSDRVVLAVPRETLARAWLGLLPGLAWAGLIALALSAVVAVLLARSIAGPLQALTRASEEMARGNYDQEIALRRNDEVGRLAAAFNAMARHVGRSHVQMRRLIADVSHDLKTPLTSILGFAQALRDGDLSGPAQASEAGAIIHEEAARVKALVDDLLYLSEIEAGQVVVAREPVDVGALAARAARRFEPALRERGVALTVTAADGLLVEGDGAKLERVLDNLLDNARKYTPAGGRVEVSAVAGAGAAPVVRLAVRNTGSAIAPEELPHLFDRFFRLDRARTRADGSGLGLAIARELVELHGGAIAAASDESGTTFTVTLPRRPVMPTVSTPPVHPAAPAPAAPHRLPSAGL